MADHDDNLRPMPHGSAYPGPPAYSQPGQLLPYQQYQQDVYRSRGYQQQRRPWYADVPPGVRYHRMTRTAALRWWHPIVGTLGIVAGGLIVVTGLMFVLFTAWYLFTGSEPPFADDTGTDLIFRDDTADLAASLFVIAVFLPLILLAAIGIQRRRPGTLSSVIGRLRWKWLLWCAGPALVTCAISYLLSVFVADAIDDPGGQADWVGWSRFLVPMLVVLLLVPFQSTAEEYFFRGWLIQAIGGSASGNRAGRLGRLFRTPWPAIAISGVVFVLAHGYTGWGIVDIFGFAVLSGWLTIRTGGLEASIAIHVANNLIAFGFSAAAGDLSLEQGSVPWQYVMTDLVPLAGFAAMVLWLVRRKQIATVTPAAPVDQPSSGSPDSQSSQESGSQPGTPSTAR